jgi:hypothetical protein
MSVFKFVRDALRRFSDDFKIADNRILCFAIGKETVSAGRCVAENVLNAVTDVQEIDRPS